MCPAMLSTVIQNPTKLMIEINHDKAEQHRPPVINKLSPW